MTVSIERTRNSSISRHGRVLYVLYVLIMVFGPVSGAHFYPAVTPAMRIRGEFDTRTTLADVAVQMLAAIVGVAIAHSDRRCCNLARTRGAARRSG